LTRGGGAKIILRAGAQTDVSRADPVVHMPYLATPAWGRRKVSRGAMPPQAPAWLL